MNLTFRVLVGFTDRSTDKGGFVTNHREVTVSATTDDEAILVSAQLIDCVIPTGSMVVSSTVLDCAA